MAMAMSRYRVRSGRQLDLVSATGHDLIARFQSGKDLYLRAVIRSQRHPLLLIAFLIQTDKYRINALLLDKGGDRYAQDILHRLCQQKDLHERTGDKRSFIIELESHRYIERVHIGSLSIR